LAATRGPLGGEHASPVSLTYLGVAGWQVTEGSHVLLVDPFFSRVAPDHGSDPVTPDANLIARYAPPTADAILVSHSHYDHLLDVPTIARKTGAIVVGTESTRNLLRAAEVPETQIDVTGGGGETFQLGPFSVRAVRSLHSVLGLPSTPIPPGVALPLAKDAYTEGGTLAYLVRAEGRSIVFLATANFIESEIDGLRPDVAVVAVYVREKVPDYTCRLMRALGRPRLVLTNHFDAHWEPLGPTQMDIDEKERVSLARFEDEVHACSPGTRVVIPTHLSPISI
jgi:L-ascorbate metabolism protein UlaG (beta-lactamase superfamily)